MILCQSGGIGRHARLKIWSPSQGVRVQLPSLAFNIITVTKQETKRTFLCTPLDRSFSHYKIQHLNCKSIVIAEQNGFSRLNPANAWDLHGIFRETEAFCYKCPIGTNVNRQAIHCLFFLWKNMCVFIVLPDLVVQASCLHDSQDVCPTNHIAVTHVLPLKKTHLIA